MRYIAFDIGSSYTKLAILDTKENTAETVAYRPTLPRLDAPRGHFAIDANDLLADVKAMLDEQLDISTDFGGIFFSTQMHGCILTRDGKPITPYITWQDARADIPDEDGITDSQRLYDTIGKEAALAMGTRFKAGIAACSLYSMLRANPMDLNGARFETLGSFLASSMSDEKIHACHLTDAASTGFAIAADGTWSKTVIEAVGVTELTFPEIISETKEMGHYRGVPFFAAIGDHQASVYGSGEGIEKSVSLTIGTATIICAAAPGYVKADMEVRPFFEDQCLMTITRQPGGRVMDIAIELIRDSVRLITGKEPETQELWTILLENLKDDTQDLTVKPDFYLGVGEGAIENISSTNLTAANLFSATLDSLANAYKGPIERLRAHNPAIDRLILCGGRLSKLPALHRRLEKVTGLPVYTAPHRDAALYGLMRIAERIEKGE